jgi:pyocin large subunit-like protein
MQREPTHSSAASSVGFRTPERLDEHYRKHGAEFSGIGKEEYLRLAQDLRDAPAGADILEYLRTDGVTTRYDRRSGAFLAFDADKTIRTFFRPGDGEHYFMRQRNRSGREQ